MPVIADRRKRGLAGLGEFGGGAPVCGDSVGRNGARELQLAENPVDRAATITPPVNQLPGVRARAGDIPRAAMGTGADNNRPLRSSMLT